MSNNNYREKNENLARKWMAKWKGGNACLWEFQITHKMLTIRITRPEIQGNLHIICGGTLHIQGPVVWESCDFQLHRKESGQDIIYTIEDEAHGLRVQCELLEVKENVKPVF